MTMPGHFPSACETLGRRICGKPHDSGARQDSSRARHVPDHGTPSGRNDGFIIITVLWILVALATLASVFSIYLANAAVAVAVQDDAGQIELLVSSALELVAYQQLAPASEKERRPTHGAFRFRTGRATVAASYVAETARIDLNAAPKAMLVGLLMTLGAPIANAEFYAERIVGWRTAPKAGDPDNEDARYRAAGLAYGPRGAPFVHPDELWLVQGLPAALVERLLGFVTIYSGRADINVFDAAPEVIAALPGMTPILLDAFLKQRASVPPDADAIPRLLGSDQAGAATAEGSSAIRVAVRIALDDGRQAASEAVVLLGVDDAPYRVVSWRDDVEAAAGRRIAGGSP